MVLEKTTLIKDFIYRNTHKYKTNDNIVFASSGGRGHIFFEYPLTAQEKNKS